MISAIRLGATVVIAVGLGVSGGSAAARNDAGADGSWGLWNGITGLLGYGTRAVSAMTGWFGDAGPGDATRIEEARGLLNLSDKEFREFDALVRATGFVLQGYSFGLERGAGVELSFGFERAISEQERSDLVHALDPQSSAPGNARRDIILALLDAARYVDAAPAGGYRLAGAWIRPGSPPDIRLRFRRIKP